MSDIEIELDNHRLKHSLLFQAVVRDIYQHCHYWHAWTVTGAAVIRPLECVSVRSAIEIARLIDVRGIGFMPSGGQYSLYRAIVRRTSSIVG